MLIFRKSWGSLFESLTYNLELLQHMILSHHGQPEFGAAVVPQCAEAELLCYIDNIDAKMEIYRENLEKTPVGGFSQRIFALEKRIYNHG